MTISRDRRRRTQARRCRTFAARLALICAFFALAVFVTPAAVAFPLELQGHDWEGCSDLVELARAELGAEHVYVVDTLSLGELTPSDALLMIHPERNLDAEELSRFMRAGGRVILLDDFGKGGSLLEHFGMERVALPAKPAESLRDQPAFALAEAASGHPVVRNLTRVVTNHASGIKHPDLSVVLRVRGEHEGDVPLAVAGSVGNGRLFAMGDSSVAMNSMLRYSGNRALAVGLLHYALEDDTWGARGGRLYVMSGPFQQKGFYGSTDDRSELERRVRAAITRLKAEGIPKEAELGSAVLLACGLALWVLRRASRTYKRELPRYVAGTPVFAQGGIAGHVAMLTRKESSRSMAMVEWKRAFEEKLALVLGLSETHATTDVLKRAEDDLALSRSEKEELRRLLLRMAEIETLLLSRQDARLHRVKESEVIAAGRIVDALLKRMDALHKREGTPT